jgi:hypothetical protein
MSFHRSAKLRTGWPLRAGLHGRERHDVEARAATERGTSHGNAHRAVGASWLQAFCEHGEKARRFARRSAGASTNRQRSRTPRTKSGSP